MGDVVTYYEAGVWKNKVEGNERASDTAPTEAAAQALGREMAVARGVEHIIKNQDGTIGECNTYPRSRDPRHIPG